MVPRLGQTNGKDACDDKRKIPVGNSPTNFCYEDSPAKLQCTFKLLQTAVGRSFVNYNSCGNF